MDGILIIDKPLDWTSHDVVGKLRKLLKTKRIGHTGTLDPFATGVLVMLVGQATRLAQFLDKDEKEYQATIRFGFETDTGDRTGQRVDTTHEPETDLEETLRAVDWREIFSGFLGEIEQTPPMYSAKKINGKKLYELARAGVEIERKPVKIKIHELEFNGFSETDTAEVSIRVVCSAGTYIRTLAEDIGRKIGIPCHLAELRRTRAGKLVIADALTIEELAAAVDQGIVDSSLIPMNAAVSNLEEIVMTDEEVRKTRHGIKLERTVESEVVRLTDQTGQLIAIGINVKTSRREQRIQPRNVVVLD